MVENVPDEPVPDEVVRNDWTFSLPAVGPPKQIAIVGDTIPGRALAVLLTRAGLEPLVIRTAEDNSRTCGRILTPSGQNVLRAMGLVDDLRTRALPVSSYRRVDLRRDVVETVAVPSADDEITPWILPEQALLDRFDTVLDSTGVVSRSVSSVHRRDDLLELEFGMGVREQFDVVVGADGPESVLRQDDAVDGATSLLEGGTVVTLDSKPTTVSDVIGDGTWMQFGPALSPQSEAVFRYQTARRDVEDGELRELLEHVEMTSSDDAALIADRASKAVSESSNQISSIVPGWTDGTIGFVGSAALPTASGASIRTTMGLEDAWVLADELVHGPTSVQRALESYQRRRVNRLRTIVRTLRSTRHRTSDGPKSKSLDMAILLRYFALGSVTSQSVVRLHGDVPLRL